MSSLITQIDNLNLHIDGVKHSYFSNILKSSEYNFLIDKWMLENPYKLALFLRVYEDLFAGKNKIYDIGGSLSCLSPLLSQNNEYFLIDPLIHEQGNQKVKDFITLSRINHLKRDWFESYQSLFTQDDIVIANDFFPNIDQRLPLFLQIASKVGFRFRLTLTWFSTPKFYHVKRTDADEHLILSQYDDQQLYHVLQSYLSVSKIQEVLKRSDARYFTNKRKVCILENF